MNSLTLDTQQVPDLSLEELLADHESAREKVEKLGRLPLSPTLKVIIWGLRVYVLFMVVVVVINAFEITH
ncbi:hypothetical protein [Sulfobacillus sp. hq2]|uniref:hypothetical protein n=1 Tax=Sulfobacillus TaxID=28033 RepID=UPI000CCFDD8A|nr:hypothetical protein [Sulfobacillus sp. hq2]POB11253.1 hypothetical protein CO251_06870 [Sulfobacillus sp. hq2]